MAFVLPNSWGSVSTHSSRAPITKAQITNERERSDTVNEQNAGVKSFAQTARAQLQKAKPQIEEIEARAKGKAN